jgi:[protein-PII] uridylyltransferase
VEGHRCSRALSVDAPALRRGVSNPIDKEELIHGRQAQAERSLLAAGSAPDAGSTSGRAFTEEYFPAPSIREIAWHTRVLAESASPGSIIVDVNDVVSRAHCDRALLARETALVHARDRRARRARAYDRRRPHRAASATQSLDTYCVLESDGSPISDRRRSTRSEPLLKALASASEWTLKVTRPRAAPVRMFSTTVSCDLRKIRRIGAP